MIAPTRKPFFTRRTIKLLSDRARTTRYSFEALPDRPFASDYGIYLHVPFCRSLCGFCPYYRELLEPGRKEAYVQALAQEIRLRDLSSAARWMYVGGGTPNLLSIKDWEAILSTLRAKVSLPGIGMELTPAGLDRRWLEGIASLGVTKASIGIQSFQPVVLEGSGRAAPEPERAENAIREAMGAGLRVNVDLMLGFAGQKAWHFRQDIGRFMDLGPQQLTIYPLMTVRGTRVNARVMDDWALWGLMEEAGKRLEQGGWKRRTLWTWSKDEGLYDSSYDELGSDYLGLGPSGISSTREWVAVNPSLDAWLRSVGEAGDGPLALRGFVNRHLKAGAHEHWRRFGMMLYERRLLPSPAFPAYLNAFILSLFLSGHMGPGGRLTRKGLIFAQDITRAIVESKSFPLQQPDCVSNLAEFRAYEGRT